LGDGGGEGQSSGTLDQHQCTAKYCVKSSCFNKRNEKAGTMKLSPILQLGLTMALLVLAVLGMQTMASAQPSNPSATSEQQGATTGLGSSHRFRSTADAATHCPGDTIVWLSGSKLVYLLPGAATYGKGSGEYACKMEADGAGFHNGGG
jgi:hypothetical protein